MDLQQKRILRALVLEMRHLLEGQFDAHGRWHDGDLERRLNALGVWRERPPKPLESLPHLADADRRAREVVDRYLAYRAKAGVPRGQAVGEFVSEAAFTWANRLLALRCMEARGLLEAPVVLQSDVYGARSLAHHRFVQRHPERCHGEDEGFFDVLAQAFEERAAWLPLLFEPAAPATTLRPSVPSLKRVLALLSGTEAVKGQEPAGHQVFAAPDAFGWAYQYWNTEEKDRVFARVRTGRGVKIEGADLIPATQLYTEPYMVKFLVQNSLGALWMGMHPDSKLCERWEYYVRDADRAPVERKDVRDIAFLDPAVGSGHFLLEAFVLLYDMYKEEGETTGTEAVCEAILTRNLHGIDIDERAVQIAEAALWMKAAQVVAEETRGDFKGVATNLVATNLRLPPGKDHLAAFLLRHPDDRPLQPALETVLSGLAHVDEIGSLVQVEGPVEATLQRLKVEHEQVAVAGGVQQNLYRPTPIPGRLPLELTDFDAWKGRTLERLKAHFSEEAESADLARRFFGRSAGRGVALFDLLSRRYDVVAANPPYMGSKSLGPLLKSYLETHYAPGKRDLYAAFILRCLELAADGGRVAMVTQQSWMFLRSFADLRALDEETIKKKPGAFPGLLRATTIETLAHLGPRGFSEISGEVVNSVLFVLTRQEPESEHRLTAFRLVGYVTPEDKDAALRRCVAHHSRSEVSRPKQYRILAVVGAPVCYWLRERFFDLLEGRCLWALADVKEGITTTDNDRFLRFRWELRFPSAGWLPVPKGGGYSRWAGFEWWALDWRDDGARLRSIGKAPLRNLEYWGRPGWTYTQLSRGALGVRRLELSTALEHKGPAICSKPGGVGLAGLLNSTSASYVARALSQGLEFRTNTVSVLPAPDHDAQTMLSVENQCIDLKRRVVALDHLESSFSVPATFIDWPTHLDRILAVSAVLHSMEALADALAAEAYGLDDADKEAVFAETGKAAGALPLLKEYNGLPPLPSGMAVPCSPLVARALLRVPACTWSASEKSANQRRLGLLFETGQGSALDEESEDTNAGDESTADECEEVFSPDARMPIPADSFLEGLAQAFQLHPISVYWLLKELREKEGVVCRPEEARWLRDRVAVTSLRLLGHRWPKQIEAGEPVPEWADRDGIIPLTDAPGHQTVVARIRERLTAELKDETLSAFEARFADMVERPLDQWLTLDFFAHHTRQFKKRPIAWQIQSSRFTATRRPVFACLAYCHAFDGDLLPKIGSQYVGPLRERLETEQRDIERIPGSARAPRQVERLVELGDQIKELRDLEDQLQKVVHAGFGPPSVIPRLRQHAFDDGMLSLKRAWLKRLSERVAGGPLHGWKKAAEETRLHEDLPDWIATAVTNLGVHCHHVGPKAPDASGFEADPTSKDLAEVVSPHAAAMVTGSLARACDSWWSRFDEVVLGPLNAEMKGIREQVAAITEDASLSDVERKRRKKPLDDRLKALKKDKDEKIAKAREVRRLIETWTCVPAEKWGDWLAEEPLYDELASIDGKRPPPRTIAEFIDQESRYLPDINDGVRVNIAPLQRAGLLASPVLDVKDVEKAIADRAEWRADERRWCREGKLPRPGWWGD